MSKRESRNLNTATEMPSPPLPGTYLHTDGTHAGPPPAGVSARDWAIHEANMQQFGPLPPPVKFWNSPAAGRRIASYPDGTFPITPLTRLEK